MTASDLTALLELQGHDTALDQLRHRRVALPARSELADVRAKRAELQSKRDEVGATRDEIATRQERAERDIAVSEKRIAEIDARMRSGQITASRDLQAMEHEIASIRERVSHLEDDALAAMDEREPFDTAITDLEARIAELDADAARLTDAVAADEQDIDAELEREQAARQAAAASVPEALLAEYERLRSRLGGVGAAKLDGNRCSGCHLTLPATELDHLKREPLDAVVHCEQCGRILVRTG